MANENNRIKVRTSSAPSGVTVSSIDTKQALEVTNNDARYYSDLAKKYKDEAKALRDDAKYYAEQNSDVTMLYVNNLEARLQGQIDGKQAVGDYALNSAIPTNVSSLNNDSHYVNSTQMNSAIDSVRLPAQTNHGGEYLSTDGENPLWKDISELKMFDLISNDHILSYEEMRGYVPLGEYVYKEAVAGAHYGYPDFYEKCLEEYNNPNNECEIIKNNYTVVGSPTITDDGIASGFSSRNYLTTIYSGTTNDFEVLIPFTVKTLDATHNILGQMLVLYANGRFVSNIGDGSKYGNVYATVNTSYLAKIKLKNGYHSLNISTDNGANWVEVFNVVNTNAYTFNNITIGCYNNYNYFKGSIDLKHLSITVDGVEVFSGNQTGIDTVKPDDYTVVGSPTISADGIASGFSSGNYLTKTINAITNNNNIIIEGKILNTEYSGGNRTFVNFDGWNANFGQANNTGIYFSWASVSSSIIIPNSVNEYIDFRFEYTANTKLVVRAKKSSDDTYISTQEYDVSGQTFSYNIFAIGAFLISGTSPLTTGTIDLNAFKIYVDGNLVYQPCLKIPYTESNTGVKVVDSAYRDRVEDMYEQFGYNPYCMSDEYHEIVTYNAVDCIRTNSNGHKFYDISNKPYIDNIYDNTGSAWFYGIDINRKRILLPRTDNANNPQNTYMVVGNTTSWTRMTSVVSQGMTLLAQVNKGMSNVALSRLDLDVSNISSVGKSRIIDWLMPDYNLGINFTSVPYTAPSNGICYVSTGAANTTAVITLNGITVGKVGYHDGNEGSISILVNKGDVISGTGNYGSPNGWFFPLKGV